MAHAQSFKSARISRAWFSNLSMASSNSIGNSAISNPTSLLVTGTGHGSFSVDFKGWLKKMKRQYIFGIVFKVKKKYPYHSGNVKWRMDIASLSQIGQFSILGWQLLQITCPLLHWKTGTPWTQSMVWRQPGHSKIFFKNSFQSLDIREDMLFLTGIQANWMIWFWDLKIDT